MQPRIVTAGKKNLIGKKIKMSLVNNQTFKLWQSFMPERKLISNTLNGDLISMQVYNETVVPENPNQEFFKWAAIEVTAFDNVPEEMETFDFKGGLYAIFDYRGMSTDTKIFEYIFRTWLTASNYALDHRPHLSIMGAKYRNNDPSSEEEIWIPVKIIS